MDTDRVARELREIAESLTAAKGMVWDLKPKRSKADDTKYEFTIRVTDKNSFTKCTNDLDRMIGRAGWLLTRATHVKEVVSDEEALGLVDMRVDKSEPDEKSLKEVKAIVDGWFKKYKK